MEAWSAEVERVCACGAAWGGGALLVRNCGRRSRESAALRVRGRVPAWRGAVALAAGAVPKPNCRCGGAEGGAVPVRDSGEEGVGWMGEWNEEFLGLLSIYM